MRILYFFLTTPFYVLGKVFIFFNLDNSNNDFLKCCNYLENLDILLDDEIIKILYLAEDHRSNFHYGIDHYAMLRAIYFTHVRKDFQGASTVAQQFVRVITGRYERTLFRKLREQLLAVLITYEFNTKIIGTAYLNIAFLGSGMNGLTGYLRRKKIFLDQLDTLEKIKIVSRLKYPEPIKDKERWSFKMKVRVGNIQSKIVKYKSLPTSL
ncbi:MULTISPECIES: transglycosylase domain-containing protein [unclassified Acinetobacter]|uniref:transglycosylase domain-containing protein n=1 Tax=unclassified Acinetobacter TaxID=196816 RepID=UPI00244A9BB1|nr:MULTISPECIES: transglycosylase domain-containing protein [unclassified Acinetobacter]MDH0031204.1 transglycosylase domain-containing protein [Acinetobacter sp. GD04021]MDH0886949.1 transglycosylase domain-containing protein [Acinetobacter sp. GD03873]MDH1083400.1 transglycosylase domain-containing protein [Acinetobacter sp. GD03983]MDH2190265.1 transglycosylase domain-containing protein [Acinetobacter sp. GD03645]MDH2203792.1 transglycosylase domain-containing protein [Acinetobacter sp. GD0